MKVGFQKIKSEMNSKGGYKGNGEETKRYKGVQEEICWYGIVKSPGICLYDIPN